MMLVDTLLGTELYWWNFLPWLFKLFLCIDHLLKDLMVLPGLGLVLIELFWDVFWVLLLDYQLVFVLLLNVLYFVSDLWYYLFLFMLRVAQHGHGVGWYLQWIISLTSKLNEIKLLLLHTHSVVDTTVVVAAIVPSLFPPWFPPFLPSPWWPSGECWKQNI